MSEFDEWFERMLNETWTIEEDRKDMLMVWIAALQWVLEMQTRNPYEVDPFNDYYMIDDNGIYDIETELKQCQGNGQ